MCLTKWCPGSKCLWVASTHVRAVTCYRQPQVLVDNHMLTSEEVRQLQDELQLRPEDEWLRLLYRWEGAAGCDLGM